MQSDNEERRKGKEKDHKFRENCDLLVNFCSLNLKRNNLSQIVVLEFF